MKNCCSEKIKNTMSEVLDSVEQNKDSFVMHPGKDFSRNRVLPFKRTMEAIIGMQGNSLNKELIDVFPDISNRPTPSALVQQRKKIKPEAFKYAFDQFNAKTETYDTAVYNGYHLFAIDGTALNIPKNENSDTYFEQGFNQFQLITLYDICSETFKDCIIQPRPKMNEVVACKELIKRNKFPEKSIIVGDRGFSSHNLYETVNRTDNLDYLIRVRNDYSNETKKLPMTELDIQVALTIYTSQTKHNQLEVKAERAKIIFGKSKFGKPKKYVHWDYEDGCPLSMRIVRFKIKDDTYETIVTSLDEAEFPISEIKKLYQKRWGIETAFRNLKYALGLSRFHSKHEDFVRQEIYAHLLMYNFSMRIAMHVGLTSSKGKYSYQINFTNAMYICKSYFRGKIIEKIEAEICACILPIRPGRYDKRKIAPKSFVPFLYRVA